MRFRFCGDLDVPEWILSEVAILSKMSSVRMMLVCRQIVEQLLGRAPISYDKLMTLTSGKRLHFDLSDVKAMVAALHFIFRNSAKYNVDENVLLDELQQLGLPKDVSTAIFRSFKVAKDKLRKHLEAQTLHLPKIQNVEWRVDYVLSSSAITEINAPSIRMHWTLSNDKFTATANAAASASSPTAATAAPATAAAVPSATATFDVTADKFRVFLSELKQARKLMDAVD